MKEMRRILALVLCFVMLVGILPVSAFATDTVPAETSVVETTEAPTSAVEDDDVADDDAQSTPADSSTVPADTSTAPADTSTAPADTTTAPADNTLTKATPDANAGIALASNEEDGIAVAANDPVVVIAASDYQRSDSGTIMTNIMNQIKKDYSSPYGALMGGDYDAGSVNTKASHIVAVNDTISGVFPNIASDNRIYLQGNHENYAGLKVDGTNLMDDSGEHDTNYYGVYAINHDDFPWTTSTNPAPSEALVKATADALGDYLEEKASANYKKPIFVMSHLPLHVTRGDNRYAKLIFDELEAAGEKGLNIIFLVGHNHSGGYDQYLGNGSVYLPKGSSLTVVNGTNSSYTDSSISFTYMNYGYLGNITGSACTHQTMTAFEITDTQVTIKRYDVGGQHLLKAAGVESSGDPDPDENEYGYAVLSLSDGKSTTYGLSSDDSNAGSGDDSTGSDDNNTGSNGTTGGSGYTYELVTSIEAGESYVIVGNDDAVALMDDNGSFGSQDVTISGTTLTSEVALTEWTISGTSAGTIVSDKGNGLSYSNSSFNLTGAADNTFNITAVDNNFTILTVRTNSGYSKYYFNYDGSGWTSKPTSTAYVRLYKLTGTGSGSGGTVTPEGGDWVTITEPDGGTTTYTYTQATSITAGEKYVIVGYKDDVALIDDNGEFGSVTDVNISGSTMTSTTELTEWTFSGSSQGSVGHGSNYLYSSGNGYTFRIDGEDTLYFTDKGNYFVIDGASSSRYTYAFYYDGTEWATSSNREEYVRLFQLTGSTPGDDATPGLFARIEGELTYNVERGLTAEQVLALVQAEIKGYEYSGTAAPGADVTGTEITEKLEFVLDSNYDGAKAGQYAVTIKYNGVTLGVAKVIVPEVPITGYECDESATVYKNSSKRVATGASLTVKYEDGTTSTVPITVSMLKDADGNAVSTAEVGSFDVYVDYNGQKFPFTLNVIEKVINDYPEYPEPGAIRFDKTAVAQGSFSKSGIAKVELSMTGVPYGSSVPTDVVIMVDMTTSMERSGYVDDANTAIKAMLEALVYDSVNDVYDDNIFVQVWTFRSDDDGVDVIINNDLPRTNIPTEEDLKVAKDAIAFDTGLSTGEYGGSGTCYDAAAKKMYDLVVDCETENVVAVFASDGGPSRYAYLNDNNGVSVKEGQYASVGQDTWFNNDGSVTEDYLTEYYTYQLKSQTPAIPVYTVAVGIDADTPEAHVLEHMSSEYDASGKVVSTAPANATTNYFARADINSTPGSLSTVFAGIAASIREAATDVVVEDKIDSHYTMNFSLPNDVTAADAGGMDDFYIQVLGYELDDHNNRKADPTVLEKFLFNSDNTITHTVGGNACGTTCTHVTKTDGTITGIDGNYFDYKVEANGDEFLTWTAEKLDRTELALEYFVYLDKSAGFDADKQVDPGTYPTNEYATISYTNFNNKRCKKEFPVPTMTWMGAKVTYVFYLVNEAGQPVNRAGKVIPFAEAIYVTDPVTYDVTWNEAESVERLSADYLADDLVPDVYELFDEQAYYELRVYQNETENSNYFQISGANNKLIDSTMDSDTTKDNSTTKVYNTKAGTKYDQYGVYSQQAVGSELNTTYIDENGNETAGTITTTVKTDGIDYANTTVAFAVVWKPELNPDAVVIDYGLDVVIDVTTNDALASGVTGVSPTAPNEVLINSGSYQNSIMLESADIKVNDIEIGTAEVENLSSVRFSLDKDNGMKFKEPAEFFYESACEYYINDGSGEPVLNMAYMYSSVTVIPATTVYYEDEFLTYTDSGKATETVGVWTTVNDDTIDNTSKVQDQDRPGANAALGSIDADNVYGYDGAYTAMSQYSMDSAKKVTVAEGISGMASFEFWGTGFDIISLTDTTTGMIVVQVFDEAGTKVWNHVVNNYFGMAYVGGEWVTVDSNDPNALYQVPVMKVKLDEYGKYTAKIIASYNVVNDVTGRGSYDFYLDAIRIYDPTGNLDTTANDAYVKDGEGWPTYYEVRDQLIDATTFDALEDEAISGMVFIDSANTAGAGTTSDVADYTSYGPNNEVYLDTGDAVTFYMSESAAAGEIAKIQMAVKTVGNSGKVEVYGVNGSVKTPCLSEEINTATDMYYDITALNGQSVVIKNAGESGIISITNVKVTYTEAQPEATQEPMMFMVRRSAVNDAIATLSVEEETIPETTVPEETEPVVPETTVPEETEPETEETKPSKPGKPNKEDKPGKGEKPEKETKPGKEDKPNKNDKPAKNDRAEEVRSNLNKAATKIKDVVTALLNKWFR